MGYRVIVKLRERRYPVLIGAGLAGNLGPLIRQTIRRGCRMAIVTDANVGRCYARKTGLSLHRAGFHPVLITLPAGEQTKSLATLAGLYRRFLKARLDRFSAVVGLGGGVVGDIAGLAAATFMRGIDFIQVPTSLLAQVDSSVGGKVAVNLPEGKNLIGTFYQPRLVVIDPVFLRTLPKAEFINGMAEVIKIALIRSPRLVRFLEQYPAQILRQAPAYLARMIQQAVALKAQIVRQDEYDRGLRQVLNYGHTIGHIIEKSGRYRRWRHGEAVSIGMMAAVQMARQMGLVKLDFVDRQSRLLARYGLPTKLPAEITPAVIRRNLLFDKKARDGQVRFVLPRGGVGQTIIVTRLSGPTPAR